MRLHNHTLLNDILETVEDRENQKPVLPSKSPICLFDLCHWKV